MSEADNEPGLELILPDERDDARDRWLWGAVLVILTLWAFSPSIWGNYIWDDSRYALNPVVQKGTDGLYDIWFNPSRIGPNGKVVHLTTPQYYPMVYTSFWIGNQLWGRSAIIEHIVNMLLQAGSALLVWEILRRLKVPGAWVAAAIFAVHPLQTESVAWLAERKNMLAGVFFFSSILTYLHFLKIDQQDVEPAGEDYWWYGLSLLLFVAGLLSKSIVCSMPVVVAILIWWKRGRLSGKNIALLMPFLVFGAAMAMVTSWFEVHIVGAFGPDWNHTPVQHILIASHIVWFYVEKLIVPANLTLIYPKWPIRSLDWLYLVGLMAVLAILIAGARKIGRGPLVAVLIYLVTLVPALGFFNVYPMRYTFVQDHFQYLSGIALIVLAVAFIARALAPLGHTRRIAGTIIAIVVIGILALVSWSHAHVYTDPETLWRDVIAKNPGAWVAHENLAGVLDDDAEANLQDSDVELARRIADQQAHEAIKQCEEALALRKNLDASYEHWGRALLILGKPAEALGKFEEAKKLNPQLITIRNNLAVSLIKLGRKQQAENEYQAALKLPGSRDVLSVMRVNFGQLLLDDGDALSRKAIAAKDAKIKRQLKTEAAGKYSEAQKQFRLAAEEMPDSANAWLHLGTVLIRVNDNRNAFDALQRAVEIEPDLAEAHADLGMLYGVAGQFAEAGQEYLKVVTLQHDNADAYANMGLLAEQLHKPSAAREFLEIALKIDPKNAKAKNALASLQGSATRPATQTTTAPTTQKLKNVQHGPIQK
ncbi:MAG TPA: tetratricopeptide repeat protein [Tepidisphaeraceae bacterium]|nr:tetratricopeptide repeat protein [Tepidisphaeraceae bacterium]